MSMFRRRLLMQNAMRQKHEYLLYSTTRDNQSVRITYKQEYFDSVYIKEDGIYMELASGELKYTFAKAGVHEVEVSLKQDITSLTQCFIGCTSLQSIPEGLFSNNTAVTNFHYCFYNCVNLTGETPKDVDGGELWERAGKEGYPSSITGTLCFRGCTKLDNYEQIPSTWK